MKNKINLMTGMTVFLVLLNGCSLNSATNNNATENSNNANTSADNLVIAFADSDKDGLADEMEKKLGTDPNKADTDEDGYLDGQEVAAGYDPLKKPEPKKEVSKENFVQPKAQSAQNNKTVNKNTVSNNGQASGGSNNYVPAYGGTGYGTNVPASNYYYDSGAYDSGYLDGYGDYESGYDGGYDEAPSDAGSYANEGFYDVLTDQGNYTDPNTGETYKVDTSGGENVWKDSYGNFVQSDDPYFDASYSDPGSGWEQMQSDSDSGSYYGYSDDYSGYGYDSYDYYASTDY